MSKLPKGAVIMWYGNTSNIPDGWHICDGENGTPNLKQKFIVGADDSHSDYKFLEEKDAKSVDRGKASVTLSQDEIPEHKHDFSGQTHQNGKHKHTTKLTRRNFKLGNDDQAFGSNVNDGYQEPSTNEAGEHDHSFSGVTKENSTMKAAHENRPPYYALYFIMKVI